MKKTMLAFISILAVGIITASCSFAEEGLIRVAAIDGKVLVTDGSASEWTQASVGQTLRNNSSIKTDESGRVYLQYPDMSSMALKPNSELTIEELSWAEGLRKVGVNLKTGEMKTAIVKASTPAEFTVKTIATVCVARGTIFYVKTMSDGAEVYVEEGAVDLNNVISGLSEKLNEGQLSGLLIDGSIAAPYLPTPEKKDGMKTGHIDLLVAEPYTEAAGDIVGVVGADVLAPDVQQEDQASRI